MFLIEQEEEMMSHSQFIANDNDLRFSFRLILPPNEYQVDDIREEIFNYLYSIGNSPDCVDLYNSEENELCLAIQGTKYNFHPRYIAAIGTIWSEAMKNLPETKIPLVKSYIAITEWLDLDEEYLSELYEGEDQLEFLCELAAYIYCAGYKVKGQVIEKFIHDKFIRLFYRSPNADEILFIQGQIFEAHSTYC